MPVFLLVSRGRAKFAAFLCGYSRYLSYSTLGPGMGAVYIDSFIV